MQRQQPECVNNGRENHLVTADAWVSLKNLGTVGVLNMLFELGQPLDPINLAKLIEQLQQIRIIRAPPFCAFEHPDNAFPRRFYRRKAVGNDKGPE